MACDLIAQSEKIGLMTIFRLIEREVYLYKTRIMNTQGIIGATTN